MLRNFGAQIQQSSHHRHVFFINTKKKFSTQYKFITYFQKPLATFRKSARRKRNIYISCVTYDDVLNPKYTFTISGRFNSNVVSLSERWLCIDIGRFRILLSVTKSSGNMNLRNVVNSSHLHTTIT